MAGYSTRADHNELFDRRAGEARPWHPRRREHERRERPLRPAEEESLRRIDELIAGMGKEN